MNAAPLLNFGCGGVRPAGWMNLDGQGVAAGEDDHFIQHDLARPMPLPPDYLDGAASCHVVEHFDQQESLALFRDLWRVLKPGGWLCVGVPNASYFRQVWPEDTRANSMALFGEAIPDGDPVLCNLIRALFFHEHKQMFTEDSLWCLFTAAGFENMSVVDGAMHQAAPCFNRHKFTLFMEGVKPEPPGVN